MRHRCSFAFLWALPAVLAACGDTGLLKIEHEGDSPGECSDGADQDRDDLFDCDDPDCAGSEECMDDSGAGGGTAGGGTSDDGDDGGDDDSGDDTAEDTATPVDRPPTAPAVAVEPVRPRDSDDLTCSVTSPSTDPDGDPVSYQYAWEADGVAVGTDATLGAAQSSEGQAVTCTVTPVAGGLSGPSASDQVDVFPDCMVHVDTNFSSDWGGFGSLTGDATRVDGAARLFRTSTEWARGTVALSREEPGALSVSARMALREGTATWPDEGQVALCLTDDSGSGIEVPGVERIGNGICLALSNETQNGSSRGAMLLENTAFDNGGSGRRLTDATDPGLDRWVSLSATRDLDHIWTFTVDGSLVGTWTETTHHTIRRITIIGGQDTHAGYGGDIDDVFVEGCP